MMITSEGERVPTLTWSSHGEASLPISTFPSQIGRYQLGRLLGKGAFGKVYETTVNGQAYAIKMIEKSMINTPSMIERVRNEVELHRSLIHPSILRLLHFFEDPERVYLLMELAPNGELYRRLQARGRFSEGEARPLFKAICEGVAHMHAHGIIHRDLKLSNILLASDDTPRIADFGLAVRSRQAISKPFPLVTAEPQGTGEQLTICGTPNYLAPEIVKREPYGMAADVWALGCLLYTLLTGRPPFETSNVRSTLEKASRADYVLPDFLSDAASQLIRRLIQVDPTKRPPVREVLEHPWFKNAPLIAASPKQTSSFPPLSMARLRPAHHRTSLASFDILGGDRLLITINPSSTTGQGSRWLLDGQHLHLLRMSDSTVRHSFPLASGLEGNPAAIRIYEHASRFLFCLRRQNPLLILMTPNYKACLRDASSIEHGRWEMEYSDGMQLHYEPTAREVKVTDKVSTQLLSLPVSEGVGPLIRNRVNECLARHAQAMATLKSYRGVYPCIVKERRSTTPLISQPSPNRQSPGDLTNLGSLFAQAVRVNIPGVGWCLADPQQCKYLLLFDDGPSVFLEGSERLAYHSGHPHAISQWYPIDHHLPPEVRDRLRHLPLFVERLRSGQGQSFHSVL